jgi:glycosyltransferase involved in cell wall biosynthesis
MSESATSEASTIWPRISLVTPVFNSAKYIEQTIRSVLAQNYPNLEYFIIDGGSTDGSVEIIRKYESQISGWVSEPDSGMYDAINKGFARTSGELMGWISATDQLHTGALAVVGSVFRDLPQVEWITGRPTGFSEDGMTVTILDVPRWSRKRFLAGANRYIQQESTFWRRSLWEKAGSHVDASRRSGSDFELWLRFFHHAQLHSVDALIGGFRVHPDSDSISALDSYNRILEGHLANDIASLKGASGVKVFRGLTRAFQRVPKLRGAWNRHVLGALYTVRGSDWPPVIRRQGDRWEILR